MVLLQAGRTAVVRGLDLDERVVRRHVSRLEAAGWLGRMPWVWGEGSVVWLTRTGLRGVDLGAVRAVKTPPSPTTVAHGVLVAWSAARMERRGLRWLSARELAADTDRWAVRMRDERGYSKQLPDLAVWGRGAERPVAIVGDEGHRREDRQRMILEGWRDAIWAEQYDGVQYDCATADEIRAIGPDPAVDEPAPVAPASAPEPEARSDSRQLRLVAAAGPSPASPAAPPTPPEPEESPEDAAERERRYREIFGIPEPKQRRRWRR
jgi:hypothetical protein